MIKSMLQSLNPIKCFFFFLPALHTFGVQPAGLVQQPSQVQTKRFATDFQFSDCAPVNRSLPLEVQFMDESVACSRILSSFRRQCRVLYPGAGASVALQHAQCAEYNSKDCFGTENISLRIILDELWIFLKL